MERVPRCDRLDGSVWCRSAYCLGFGERKRGARGQGDAFASGRLEAEEGVDLGTVADIVAEGAGGGDMDEGFTVHGRDGMIGGGEVEEGVCLAGRQSACESESCAVGPVTPRPMGSLRPPIAVDSVARYHRWSFGSRNDRSSRPPLDSRPAWRQIFMMIIMNRRGSPLPSRQWRKSVSRACSELSCWLTVFPRFYTKIPGTLVQRDMDQTRRSNSRSPGSRCDQSVPPSTERD